MWKYRLFGVALVFYEIGRLVLLLMVFAALAPEGEWPFPWLSLVAPGALFFLMALSMLRSGGRGRLYGPLFMTGKALCLFTAGLWLFFLKGDTLRNMALGGQGFFVVPVLILGDALSILLVSAMIKAGRRR